MKSDISIAQVRQFPILMWILLFGSFITRGSFYMVWPFLAVILYDKFALSATEVGAILSLAAMISVFVSFIGSVLSDRFGRKPMMYGTGILYVIAFSLLAEANSVATFVVVLTLCSIATSLWRPLTSALIGDLIANDQTRELAMQALYFAVNVGCAVGPLLGFWFGLTGEQSSFYITVAAFALLLVLLFVGFRLNDNLPQSNTVDSTQPQGNRSNDANRFRTTLRVLIADRLLQCLLVANIVCLFVYGQMDSSLIQYLTRAEVPDLLTLISAMIFTNAIVIISSQFVLLKLMASRPLLTRIRIGLLLLMASQVCFFINPLDLFYGWIGAVVVMSLAEAILFPTMSVHVDRIAPRHLRGAYFGATSFYDLGFALAPIGGGLILDYFSGDALFVMGFILTCAVLGLYSIMDKLPRPDFTAHSAATVPS